MNSKTRIENSVYYRLVALWILCEAMLGGIIHGARIPATGLIVGSCAIICIALIAYHVPAKGAILKATLIVAIFKMMLSPQAPPTAYLAVFFQGLLGEALFWNRKGYALSCLLFGILVLLESGLQRMVVLTIVYGKDLWQAVNTFINGMTGQATVTNYSLFMMMGYVLLHLIVGAIVGFWVGRLPQKIRAWTQLYKEYIVTLNDTDKVENVSYSKRKKTFKVGTFIIWFVLLTLYIQSSYNMGPALLPPNIYLRILIRSLLILTTCYFVLGPMLTFILNRWLQMRKLKDSIMIHNISQFLPSTKKLIVKSWQLAASQKGGRRVLLCGKIVLLNTLYE